MATQLFNFMFTILFSLVVYGVHGRSFPQQDTITVKMENGQTYDCVNFYEQPAFSHPLQRNLSTEVRANIASIQRRNLTDNIGIKGVGCPDGTVPILRSAVGINDRLPQSTLAAVSHCSAVIRTRADDPNKRFRGSLGALTLYKPVVQPSQWSTARIKVINGPDSIEVGWMVNPELYKDNEAHLYGKFTSGGEGCYNLQCPGFVQVSKDIPLGVTPTHYCNIASKQYFTWTISVDKRDDGNWWLFITPKRIPVGYWPGSRFTKLKDIASQIEWGGEISNPVPTDIPPEMGSGLQATYDTYRSAFFMTVRVIDERYVAIQPEDTEKFMDCEDSYTTKDHGYQGPYWGRIMYFGGTRDE